mmetsp:Transcript_127436/g.354764  ORF Transcript_127436/g.354764 Transcript_127436/m.354764 type:complete len:114 (-) Transcript_127436:759-1100(-)
MSAWHCPWGVGESIISDSASGRPGRLHGCRRSTTRGGRGHGGRRGWRPPTAHALSFKVPNPRFGKFCEEAKTGFTSCGKTCRDAAGKAGLSGTVRRQRGLQVGKVYYLGGWQR